MNKKTVRNLIIAGTVGLTATTVGLTTALTACSTTATQTFSAESINNLKSAITNAISSEKLTRSEFNADMFDIVCDNFISNDENLGKLVNEVTFSEQNPNRIVIKLNSSVKYSLPEDFNDKSVALRENTLSITFSELNFYQAISFINDSLVQLRNSILNEIKNSNITIAGIYNYFKSTIVDQINNLQTSNNINLSNYINTPTYSQETNSINITLKDNIGLYKFSTTSSEGIQVTNSQITLNNIAVNPSIASPESWFNWGTGANANQITGLSSTVQSQTNIVLPARATSIVNNLFINLTNLTSIDMSLTNITELPSGEEGNALFQNCSNLVDVSLPKNLESIGDRAFLNCINLKWIDIPKSVTNIGRSAFNGCISITSIDLPENLKTIGIMLFRNCSALKSITMPENLDTISDQTFNSCSSLESIEILSPSVTFGNDKVFQNVPSTCVATVKNSTVQTALRNAGFTGTININPNLN